LAYEQKTILVKTNPKGNNDAEKEFLGYEFSNRRGHEGIRMFTDAENQPTTKLYHETNRQDFTKVSSYIYQAFLGLNEKNLQNLAEENGLSENLQIQNLYEMMNFESISFDKAITTSFKKKVKTEVKSKWDLVRLGDVCNIKIGGTPDRYNQNYWRNGIHLWVSIADMNKKNIFETNEKINDLAVQKSNVKLIKAGTTLISFKLSVGKVSVAGVDLYTNEAIAGLEIANNYTKDILDTFLFHYFSTYSLDNQDTNLKKLGKVLNSKYLQDLKIPLPDFSVQQQIISEIEEIEQQETAQKERKEVLKSEIENVVNQAFKEFSLQTLSKIIELQNGKGLTKYKLIKGDFNVFGGNGINGKHNEYLVENPTIAIGRVGEYCGAIHVTNPKSWITDNSMYVSNFLIPIELKYLYFMLKHLNLRQYASQASHPNLSQPTILNKKIPLPPLAIQTQVLAKIAILETELTEIAKFLDTVKAMKETVLQKYL
jgi:restriction endonuclease S subunit